MAVTRIKNNQITDATITAAKIASQTLVGSLFATDLTLNSNLSVIGNLTVTGTSSNINAINTFISDPFVIFNNGYTGSLTNYTIGILVNRNLASLSSFGAVNTAWVWSEADAAFTGIATTDTGTGVVSINNAGYANIKIGNLNAVTAVTASSITATTLNFTNAAATTLVATNFSTGNAVISGGYISNLANATITTGNVQNWYATNLNSTNGNVTTLTATTINAGTTTSAILNATTGNVTTLGVDTTTTVTLNATTGNITTLGAGTTTTATLNATTGNITTLGAGTTTTATLNATTGNITTLGAGTTTTATLNATTGNVTTLGAGTTTTATLNSTNGNITTLGAGTTTTATLNATTGNITSARATTLVADNFSSGNVVLTGGSVNNTPIGNTTPSTGAFTTLTTNGATTFTNAAQSDNASTGALVVTGGVGVGANLNVAGNVTITGNLTVLGNTTTLNTESLDVEDLNITIAANASSGAAANGAGLTVAGANATLTYLNADDSWNFNKKLNSTTVNAAAVNVTNANVTTLGAGTTTSATLNATTGNITTLTATTVNAGTTTSATLNATTGNVTTLGVGTTTSATLNATTGNITNGAITTLVATNFSTANAVVTGGSLNNATIGLTTPAAATVTLLKTTGNIVAGSGTNATNFTTGALVVPNGGGVGITGDLYVQGPSTFQGNISAGNIILSGNINVPVGGTFSNTGVFFGNTGGIGALYAGTSTYTALPTTVLQMTGNVNTYAQTNFQNINSGASATTDFVLTADNGTDSTYFGDFGVLGSTYNGTLPNSFVNGLGTAGYANDTYLYAHGNHDAPGIGGNLLIGTSVPGTVIRAFAGGMNIADVITTTTSSGFHVNASTVSTSITSGALRVLGGAGIAGNINVGNAAAFNLGKTANFDFVVKGKTDDTLVWARPSNTYDQLVIGNSATTSTLVTGAKLIINTTDSILIPVGTTAQRPGSAGGTDTAGMIRFNTSNAQLEFYNGSSWTNTGTSFTVVASDTFDGDDITTVFTLGASATTQSVIVSLNGVLQIPTIAYSVSGSTLTFTSPPATGDKIEVRRLTTTATVSTFESGNGYVSFTATNTFANINAGTGAATNRMSFNTTGNVSVTANIAPSANVSYDLGNVNSWWKNTFTNKVITGGADLAENYVADAVYTPGTVVEFGGEAEVTVSMTEGSVRVAGVITSDPGHVMNGGLKGSTVASVALVGRVPVNVIGPVYKGDMLISAGYGYARACASPVIGSVIGKAVANFEGEKGTVEVVVGRL
jgi:hypothetical protein